MGVRVLGNRGGWGWSDAVTITGEHLRHPPDAPILINHLDPDSEPVDRLHTV